MPALIQDVQTLLATLAPAGGVWYGLNTAQPQVFPYIVWSRVASTPTTSLGGPSLLQNTRLQIDIYARTVSEAATIESALETAMQASSITNVSLSSQDIVEPDTRLFHVIKDYSVWATN
jgi:hypothetical protein